MCVDLYFVMPFAIIMCVCCFWHQHITHKNKKTICLASRLFFLIKLRKTTEFIIYYVAQEIVGLISKDLIKLCQL